MAFCKNCGTDIGNSKFCPSCGESINTDVSTAAFSTRENALKEVERMYSYFSQKGDVYAEYDKTRYELAEIKKKSVKGLATYAGIAIGIGIVIILIRGKMGGFTASLLFSGILCAVLAPVLHSKRETKIKELTAIKERVENELLYYYQKFPNCLVGFEYTYPYVIKGLRSIIGSGRADSIKEAINIQINDEHNHEMKVLAQKTYVQAATAAAAAVDNAYHSANTDYNMRRSSRILDKFWTEHKNS